MKKNILALLSIALLSFTLSGQNLQYTKAVLEKLCAPDFFGRGYVQKGDSLAADFIASEFRKNKVKAFNNNYIQRFEMSINSQPKADLWLNGEKMKPDGYWMIEASSPTMKGTFPVVTVDSDVMKNPRRFIQSALNNPEAFYFIDSLGLNNPELYSFAKSLIYSPIIPASGIIEVVHRYPFGVPRKNFDPYAKIQLHNDIKPSDLKEISIDNENYFVENYLSQNVIGYVKGKSNDWVVFTAHYDGEGSYGEVIFPAANDNGSGTAMVMDLARHYAAGKKPYYNIAFLLVSGEEAGLLGSRAYVKNPVFPLEDIRMVINLDMVASGQDGCLLFNGDVWPFERDYLLKNNQEKGYLPQITVRGPAANSDHHSFHEVGVPAVFFITQGKAGPGHTAFDFAKDSHFPKYNELFNLVTDFVTELPNFPEPIRYPLTDYHIHLKGDMTYEKAIEKSQKSGIRYGVAVNCGVGFPVNSDEGALEFLKSMEKSPFLKGMQAEGREWVTTFSMDVIDQFDYVFTDAMTYFDEDGERVRLWMSDEVVIEDPERFMDGLTDRIVEIVSNEPIDIYVNSTFLPEVIAEDYDKLWTTERMDKVITALVKSGVAMEINNRYKIPSETFIRRAKEAGVKFAFGTNNTDSNTRDLDYCREMISKCRLTASDIWSIY
jgi:aminopeptidase YwaD